MFKKLALSLLVVSVFSGCATPQPVQSSVVPLPGGKYEISSSRSNKADALRAALAEAESTCHAKKMRHVVLERNDAYSGLVSEESNKQIETAAQVLALVSNSWVPTLSSDDDHRVQLTFTCEPVDPS